ncbi:MAG: FtsX-like permease family protein [Bacteroidota bacterium]
MNNKQHTPPAWADQFLAWFCDEGLLEEIQGDLHEAYYDRLTSHSKAKADQLFVLDVFRFCKPYAFEKYSTLKQYLPMFQNYLKIGLRNILHRKGFTAINLIGLSVGISAVMLILLYWNSENTYDTYFPDHDRIHRLMNNYREQTYTCMRFTDYYQTSREDQLRLTNRLKAYEEVQAVCHFVPSVSAIGGRDKYFIQIGKQEVLGENFLYLNSGMDFQEVFPLTFLKGSPEQAFTSFQTISITDRLAKRWFGESWKDQNLINQDVTIQDEVFRLAGIVEALPGNVHFDFDIIIHQQEIPSWAAYTYFKLADGYTAEQVMDRIAQEVDNIFPGYTEDVLSKGIISIPLTKIHFSSGNLYEIKVPANKAYLDTFAVVGLIILLIIWTNYTNLSVSMYAERQRELGMRKVVGALARDISMQILIEAILLALCCLPICYLLIYLSIPYYNEMMGIQLGQEIISSGPYLGLLVLLLAISGLISGIYPSITYGRKSLPSLLWAKTTINRHFRLVSFRNFLLTTQFVMMVGLLSVTWFIYQQMGYVAKQDLGYEVEGVVYFEINGAEKYKQLSTYLRQIPEVQETGANGVPGSEMFNQLTYKMEGTDRVFSDGTFMVLDYGSLKTLNIKCETCTSLDEGKRKLFIINRTAAHKLASVLEVEPEQLIGKQLITEPEWENEEHGMGVPHRIDGIIDDYKYFSLKYPHQPLLINVAAEAGWAYQMMVRLQTDDWQKTLEKVKEKYEKVETVIPFDPLFLEERIRNLYTNERRSGSLMGIMSALAILLSFMGLVGIVSHMAFNRQKEISIRKVLGASIQHILLTLNREFILLMLIATIISLPVALFFASKWLESFAFKIALSPTVVFLVGIVALGLVVSLVSFLARETVNKDPAEVLRA